MKAFLYCETTDGGMLTHFYLEHQLEKLQIRLLQGLGKPQPGDKWYRKAMEEDVHLLTAAKIMDVGAALNHRIGVLIRLKDDHPIVS